MPFSPLSKRRTEHRGKLRQHTGPGDRPLPVWTLSRHQLQGERWQCPGCTARPPARVQEQLGPARRCESTCRPQGLKRVPTFSC